eukprot:TRINITY_DN1447_c0_g1_i1.p1 TRINITY_DN1447_c0_g1~~TRINITY_DN1447_c0_g1_i1.p1  ORF type:complete len:525 (+),score=106.35 TRINITY_DN1447_c0_g1_i1:19-1593(+)
MVEEPIIQCYDVNEAAVQTVTVFSDRAEVTRNLQLESLSDIDEEKGKIVIKGFQSTFDAESIRIGGTNVGILEVVYGESYVQQDDNSEEKEEIFKLQDSIKRLNLRNERLIKKQQWLDQFSEAKLNPKTDAESNSVSIMDFDQVGTFLDFFADQIRTINQQLKENNNELEELNQQLNDLNLQRNARKIDSSGIVREITILCIFTSAIMEIELKYISYGASWTSSYDLRANTQSNMCALFYYGMITNSTGEDWNEVDVILSTAEPSISGSPPLLLPLKVTTRASKSRRTKKAKSARKESSAISYSINEFAIASDSSGMSATYSINRKCSIDSDDLQKKTTIAYIEMDLILSYITKPTASQKAFTKSNAVNTSAFVLLPGPMNVFMDSFFLSSSHLELTHPDEDIELYLGADDSIEVKQEPTSNNEAVSGILSKKKTIVQSHHFTITNMKEDPIKIEVFDQVPVSNYSSGRTAVKVKITEPEHEDDQDIDEFGLIRWVLDIAPGEKQRVKYSYSLELKPDMQIRYQ